MRRHKDKLARNATLNLLGPRKSKKKDTVMASFKNLLKTVKLATGEYHIEMDPRYRKKEKGRPPGAFA